MCAHKSSYVPHGTIRFLQIFGHLAGWATLYSVGVALVLCTLVNLQYRVDMLIYVAICAHAGYLLDRVKLRDQQLDPADLMADPQRHHYLRRNLVWIRKLMILEWLIALIVGVTISPLLGGLVFVGVLAGFAYAGWKPGRISRLKDLSGLKAVPVSGAVVGLATAAVYRGDIESLFRESRIIAYLIGIGFIVFGDAVICDLDDQLSDKQFRTRSLPVMLGRTWATLVGISALILGSGVLLSSNACSGVLVFGSSIVLSAVLILILSKHRRDWIDGRLFVIALITALIGI